MGINRQADFRSPSEEAWHQLGHRLAPKEPWDGLLEKPGMRQVLMQGVRPDDRKGHIFVTVQPSLIIKPWGVRINVNDHYENDGPAEENGCGRMMFFLSASYEISLERSLRIMQRLMQP